MYLPSISSVTPTEAAASSVNWCAPSTSVTTGKTAATLPSQTSVDWQSTDLQDDVKKFVEATLAPDTLSLTLTLGTSDEGIPNNDGHEGIESPFTEPNSLQDGSGSHEQNDDVADETSLDPGMSKERIAEEQIQEIVAKWTEFLAAVEKLSPEQQEEEIKNLEDDLKDLLKGEGESVQELDGHEEIAKRILRMVPQEPGTSSGPSKDMIQKTRSRAVEVREVKTSNVPKTILIIIFGSLSGIVVVGCGIWVWFQRGNEIHTILDPIREFYRAISHVISLALARAKVLAGLQ
ncbi:hypothetical protein QFC19_000453 [Naganishia cerealis]|uniref:Uncharacterized protein n=1 Tax=Naganishia cerealis TaxID=610337 RepID=A0ACC2WMC9_9TREE|nr:hypothetical protein QFC19_000453 [Naganishia cerealis]